MKSWKWNWINFEIEWNFEVEWNLEIQWNFEIGWSVWHYDWKRVWNSDWKTVWNYRYKENVGPVDIEIPLKSEQLQWNIEKSLKNRILWNCSEIQNSRSWIFKILFQ